MKISFLHAVGKATGTNQKMKDRFHVPQKSFVKKMFPGIAN
jgi:hypothetical protein